MKNKFIIFNERMVRIEYFLIAVLSIIILGTIFIQVVCRYILLISTPWAEEIARYSFIALTYIGSGIGIYNSQFVSVDLMPKIIESTSKNPDRNIKMLEYISKFLILLFLMIFLIYYWPYFSKIAKLNQVAVATKIPMVYPMSTIIIGTIFMIIHCICLLVSNEDERNKVKEELKQEKKIKRVVNG